jgi:hypothetical protein
MADYLPPDLLDRVRGVAIEQFADQGATRPLLFEHINRRYTASLPVLAAPAMQIMSDLMKLNGVERLVDTTVPLAIWLRNARGLTLDAGARGVLDEAADVVASASTGEPDLGPAGDVSEVKEEIVFRDDTVAIGFLGAGAAAARAVGRIRVTPYEAGRVRLAPAGAPENPHAGTCWLIADDLVVTNHHVINARSALDGPAPRAAEDDLRAQAAAAVVNFDYDREDLVGDDTAVAELLAWDPGLDYAVLRLAAPGDRQPLPLLRTPFRVGPADNVAVNVIQHPEGLAKRIGLRNNIVESASDRDVRYFTDTRAGSSGSPVLTDGWAVCALHRGARHVTVRFQGKTSAFVNVGTQITAVLDHLEQTNPKVYAALPAA